MRAMTQLVAVCLVLVSGAVMAVETATPQGGNVDPQQRQQRVEQMKARWEQMDANHDGKLSREEMEKNAPRLAQHFDQLDLNGDGQVTPEELREALQARKNARAQRGNKPQE